VGQGLYEGGVVMPKTKEEIAAYNKAYYIANKDKLSAKNKKWYIDNKEKALELRRAYYKDNIERYNEYREANKEKIAARMKAWGEANKEEIAARQKAYYKANKDKCRKANKKWVENNKERLQKYYKEYKASGKRKEYQQNNKHIYQNNASRYRALKRKQIPLHLRDCPQEKQRLLQTYKLRNILTEATGVQHHVDHMWPLADGGPHWSGNLQVIPAEENMSKHASVCEETKATIIKSLYTFDTSSPI
jgi:hypothetical protein